MDKKLCSKILFCLITIILIFISSTLIANADTDDLTTPINVSNKENDEALITAVSSGDIEEVGKLLENGANVDSRDDFGDTCLMIASNNCFEDIVSLLIKWEADVDAKNDNDYTALIYSVHKGNLNITRTLIDSDADVNAATKFGQTALMYAAEYDYADIAKLLIVLEPTFLNSPHTTGLP